MTKPCAFFLLLGLLGTAAAARGEQSPTSYALVIGSNEGGPGQKTLQYAERDAQRFAEILAEVGRTPPDRVKLLLAPSLPDVYASLGELHARLDEHAARGETTQLVFFYSGHARAHGANLGHETLPLGELRELLTALPTTLTVVVLDACQSGAFSGIKGARPASDFSVNSVDRLNTRGLAVLASSSETELSQESDSLGSGFFAHHLMVAMRGAGDANTDGRVSLDEAYRYAYERTLADTARTRVGSQHVTLETDLKGKGDVPLAYPAEASAQLKLAKSLTGTLLVQQAGKGAVMAEVVKSPSAPLTLALPPGRYEAVLRRDDRVYECSLRMREGGQIELDPDACTSLTVEEYEAKGQPPPRLETWFFEMGIGPSWQPMSDFVRTLERFEYEPTVKGLNFQMRLSLGRMLTRHFGVGLSYQFAPSNYYTQYASPLPHRDYGWSLNRLSVMGRASLPIHPRWFVLYADASVGVAMVREGFAGPEPQEGFGDELPMQYAVSLEGSAGIQSNVGRRAFGLFLEGGYGWAPAPENLLGQKHNGLGARLTFGFRIRLRSR